MFSELEEQLKELEGIISCKITDQGELEEIDEIHIVADRKRDPKRIVRDVETMVLVNTGEEISHKKISIAQINSSQSNAEENRIEIISIYKENNRMVYHFKLKINNTLVEEQVEGTVQEALPVKVAEGMIDIIQKYTSFPGKIRVENVFTTGINGEIVTVQLVLYRGSNISNQERLVGATYVNHNLPLATGKACLKALNRRLKEFL